jgi:outer membrane receptor for ferric coprogen and ferric-rhodotorulic acid
MMFRLRAAFCLLFMILSAGVFAQNSGGAQGTDDKNFTGSTSYDDTELDDFFDFGEDSGIDFTKTPETTQQMTVITKEEIEKRNANDLASLLEETLDMSVTRYGAYGSQTELNMRGFDTERIAILIEVSPPTPRAPANLT